MLLREKSAGIIQNTKGQITIFLATSVVVMITLMAFIINIGIFVKAKINLQNATDAAAYAGASVQARQLTNIAYLNWEMRNIYKEWMFKYYVLGGLNLRGVTGGGTDPMDFTMEPYQTGSTPSTDNYNFPSTCIDFAGTGSVGLCTKALIPGLPRFKSDQVIGMSETTNAFIDAIVSQKSNDCTQRSQVNFYTANTWAFNVIDTGDDTLNNMRDLAPEIAAGRMGAFPQAFEVALRIRNLEAQVNKAPQNGVCVSSGANPNCQQGINDIITSEQTPSYERLYKAFYSGYRNLGSEGDTELRKSFTLTEIAPQETSYPDPYSLSTLLIPNGSAQTKRYLDLKLMTLNFAAFYTAFTTNQDVHIIQGQPVASEGQCTATKMGLPVPGYPMGFVKSPDLITYYAVKGEAQFVGLFNPFKNTPINLTAFAAAKPFGGRIGPMLFRTNDSRTVLPRREGRRSSPYISALDTNNFVDQFKRPTGGGYRPGVPLPLNIGNDQFWLTGSSDPIGGYVGSGQSIYFGVPNLAYDYPSGEVASRESYTSLNFDIQLISNLDSVNSVGLYNKNMFDKFKNKLRGVGGVVTSQAIDDAILMVKAPTLLEAHNYLIPTPEDVNKKLNVDSFGVIHSDADASKNLTDNEGKQYNFYTHNLYAPVFSDTPDSLYHSDADIRSVLENYLNAQEPALIKYIESMSLAAQQMYQSNPSTNSNQNLAIDAAEGISDIPVAALTNPNPAAVNGQKPTCESIAGQFAYFYLGDASQIQSGPKCPTPLSTLMLSRWANFNFKESYPLEFTLPEQGIDLKNLFSAYRPGVEHDANNGEQTNPVNARKEIMLRNFYSTKFVSLSSLVVGTSESYANGIATFSEGSSSRQGAQTDTAQGEFKNPIVPSSVNLDLTKIRH